MSIQQQNNNNNNHQHHHQNGNGLSDYEAALYDRGIRVWGVDTQNRLRQSHILVLNLTAQNSEVCKNIALSGVGSITVVDNHLVDGNENSLFVNNSLHIGKVRGQVSVEGIQDLNPLIKVQSIDRSIDSFDDEFIKQYTLVCADSIDFNQQSILNQLCRRNNVYYLLNHSFGMNSFFFSDLGDKFDYTIKKKIIKPKSNPTQQQQQQQSKEEEEDKEETQSQSFSSLKDALLMPWNKLNIRRSPLLIYILTVFGQYQTENNSIVSKDLECKQKLQHILNEKCKQYNISDNTKLISTLELVTRQLNNEIPPISAIVGGIVGQEIVRIISKDQEIINNTFYYDAMSGGGLLEQLTSK